MLKSFEDYLEFGKEGEHYVANWLIGRGNVVAPLYQYNNHNKAPVILWDESGRRIQCVLPDLQCYKHSKAWFAEVKRKNQWWQGEYFETGVDIRLWKHYQKVRQQTGCDVWIFFLHENMEPTGLFAGEVMALHSQGPRIWENGTPLVFFRREWLKRVAPLEDLNIDN